MMEVKMSKIILIIFFISIMFINCGIFKNYSALKQEALDDGYIRFKDNTWWQKDFRYLMADAYSGFKPKELKSVLREYDNIGRERIKQWKKLRHSIIGDGIEFHKGNAIARSLGSIQ